MLSPSPILLCNVWQLIHTIFLATCFCFQHALSVLQTKAEEEISKARKLISEKDAELHEAEESLSGLKEVMHLCFYGLLVH